VFKLRLGLNQGLEKTMKTVPNYYRRPALEDPQNSWSVFERGRTNDFGEPYCVAAAVTLQEAERMVKQQNQAALREAFEGIVELHNG
jgi:hypothetical protein